MIDYNNYKPYRTKAQKKLARQTARKCADGTYRSDAPVSYHKSIDNAPLLALKYKKKE